jgi:catechol 2,3-dioxygenase-like lactoylglutathione lyase family enzyme
MPIAVLGVQRRTGRGGGYRPPMHRLSPLGPGSLGQVSLQVQDVVRAEQFYGDTPGLLHVFTFGDLAFFDVGGTRLYLHRKDADEWQPGSILYFVVDDIAAAYAELGSRGVELKGEPHRIFVHEDTGLEEWMAFFADGEGNTLALMEQRIPPHKD